MTPRLENSMRSLFGCFAILIVALLVLPACSPETGTDRPGTALEESPRMDAARLAALIEQIDPNATLTGSTWRFEAADYVVALVFDERADRMRIMIPITSADKVTPEQQTRMLQANFDTALDARYAIAQDLVWGTFIHPLSPLTESEFLLGLGQTISVVETFGDTYSSGMFTFGAGDSVEIERERMIDLLRKQQT